MTSLTITPAAGLPPRAWIVTVNTDLPALALLAGDVLAVRSQDRWDCDALYQTVTGDVVKIQTLFDGTVRITAPDGAESILAMTEAHGLICGLVIDAAETMGGPTLRE